MGIKPSFRTKKRTKGTKGAKETIDVTELRKQLAVTQQEFATLLGLSTTTISRWERNRHEPEDGKQVYLELLARSLQRRKPPEVVKALRSHYSTTDVERIIQLVHLGD